MKILPTSFATTNFEAKKKRIIKTPEQIQKDDERMEKITKYSSYSLWLSAIAAFTIYGAVSKGTPKNNTTEIKPQEKAINIDKNFKDTVIIQDINDDNSPEIIFIDKDKNKVAYDLQTHKIIRQNNEVDNDD